MDCFQLKTIFNEINFHNNNNNDHKMVHSASKFKIIVIGIYDSFYKICIS
jgi:hypothetical protein